MKIASVILIVNIVISFSLIVFINSAKNKSVKNNYLNNGETSIVLKVKK
jgi:hypothetical protein